MKTKILVGLLSLGFAFTAGAEEEQERVIREPDRQVIRKTTTVDFNETEIDGNLKGPDGSFIPGRERSHFESLLKPRSDFLPELEKSTEAEGM